MFQYSKDGKYVTTSFDASRVADRGAFHNAVSNLYGGLPNYSYLFENGKCLVTGLRSKCEYLMPKLQDLGVIDVTTTKPMSEFKEETSEQKGTDAEDKDSSSTAMETPETPDIPGSDTRSEAGSEASVKPESEKSESKKSSDEQWDVASDITLEISSKTSTMSLN